MRISELFERKKRSKKTRGTGGYFFPGYGYYGGGDSGDGGGDGGESRSGMAKGSQQISEYRDRLLQYVKSLLPNYPEYVLKDWLVPNKGNFSNLPDTDLKNGIMEKLKLAGLTPNTKWQLVPNMQFTMDMFEPMTKQRLIGRAGGSSDLGMGIPRDKERHATQAALAQQQGGVRKEPVLLIKTDKGYELLEGWHRTIQHFAKYPDGYIGPAYIAVAQPGVAEGSLNESAVFLNPTTVVVGQAHGQPLELSPDTLKKIQDIAAKHGAWYEGNGTDRSYTKGQIDRYVGSWDDEVAKTASPNDPKWLYVLFANVDENNRVKRVGVDPKDTIFNRLMDSAQDNSFQGIGFTALALKKFLSMASEGKYDFVKMSQQPATQENLTRFLKAGEALMWPSNWEQYPNRAGKIAKAATVDVRDQYLASRKAGVYVTGSGHLKAVQNITDQQGVAEAETATQNSRQLAKEFRQLGYSQIGSGADATVWARDDSHVIKILMPEDAGSRAEQIFRKFYEFSITHQDLACVPRFNEVNTIDINGQDYTQIEMERLAPIEPNTFMEGIVWLLSDYVAEQTPWPTIESEFAMPDTWEMYSPNYANALAQTWQSLLENPAGRKTYAMYRQLYNVMKLLFATGTINKFGWDLHTANVMRRNNGQPVIIDPWFSQGTS